MKIMVMKSTNLDAWYKKDVGKTFSVVNSNKKYYYVKVKNPATKKSNVAVAVLKSDCEIIEA